MRHDHERQADEDSCAWDNPATPPYGTARHRPFTTRPDLRCWLPPRPGSPGLLLHGAGQACLIAPARPHPQLLQPGVRPAGGEPVRRSWCPGGSLNRPPLDPSHLPSVARRRLVELTGHLNCVNSGSASPETGVHWLLEWLLSAGPLGSGSLLSVWSWNRTTPWTAGQSQCGEGLVRPGSGRGFVVRQMFDPLTGRFAGSGGLSNVLVGRLGTWPARACRRPFRRGMALSLALVP